MVCITISGRQCLSVVNVAAPTSSTRLNIRSSIFTSPDKLAAERIANFNAGCFYVGGAKKADPSHSSCSKK